MCSYNIYSLIVVQVQIGIYQFNYSEIILIELD